LKWKHAIYREIQSGGIIFDGALNSKWKEGGTSGGFVIEEL
jgi:hypothetical protein